MDTRRRRARAASGTTPSLPGGDDRNQRSRSPSHRCRYAASPACTDSPGTVSGSKASCRPSSQPPRARRVRHDQLAQVDTAAHQPPGSIRSERRHEAPPWVWVPPQRPSARRAVCAEPHRANNQPTARCDGRAKPDSSHAARPLADVTHSDAEAPTDPPPSTIHYTSDEARSECGIPLMASTECPMWRSHVSFTSCESEFVSRSLSNHGYGAAA